MKSRIDSEIRTLETMMSEYCRTRHGSANGLCAECRTLLDYAADRTRKCVFGDGKPTCRKCDVHCYRQAERDRIRSIMRSVGPHMLFLHPVLTIRHFLRELF